MPPKTKKKAKKAQFGGDDGWGENFTNVSGDHGLEDSVTISVIDKGEGSYDSIHANEQNNVTVWRKNTGSMSMRTTHKETLGPWLQATNEAVRDMVTAERTIKKLQDIMAKCTNEFEMIDDTARSLHQSEEYCKEKDDQLKRLEGTIFTLRSMDAKARAGLEHDVAQIKKERDELEQEKAKQAKRVAVATEEEKLRLKIEYDDRAKEQEDIHKAHVLELESDFAQKHDENSKKVQALETELTQSITAREGHITRIENQAADIEEMREKNDTLIRAKDSLRKENIAQKKALDEIQKEFALDTKPKAFFTHRFVEIQTEVERISLHYFGDVEGKGLEQIHNDLAAKDACFKSVPIDESDDSYDLCAAHAQRIISSAIMEEVWKPLFDELSLPDPKFSAFLRGIIDGLQNSGHGGRTPSVWIALTMRALQSSSQADSTTLEATERIISRVSILSPLTDQSKSDTLRQDLTKLVKLAAEVWQIARASGWQLSASQSFDQTNYADWRSSTFDPVPLPSDSETIDPDMVSQTHPRIFTLFPKIEARGVIDLEDQEKPSSESDLICIHPGIGLPEWAPLVVRGKNEQEERDIRLRRVMEDAKKEIYSNKRFSSQSRRDSRVGSMSGIQPSVSEQWKKEGAMTFMERV